ncbi:hypothetical protein ACHAWF_004089 [Thalassiosira exigua]
MMGLENPPALEAAFALAFSLITATMILFVLLRVSGTGFQVILWRSEERVASSRLQGPMRARGRRPSRDRSRARHGKGSTGKNSKGKKSKGKNRAASALSPPPTDNAGPSLSVIVDAGAARRLPDLQQRVLRYRDAMVSSLPPEVVVDAIRRGENIPTQAEHNICRRRLVEAGMVDAVLGLLFRCEDEALTDVLRDAAGPDAEQRCEGVVALPSVWVNLLVNTLCDDDLLNATKINVLIAEGIGPLVRCMVDDMRRELFKDNRYWHEVLSMFSALLQNLAGDTLPTLLVYEGLADWVIQRCFDSMFFESHRPDIVEESKVHGKYVRSDTFSVIALSAGFVIEEMADVIRPHGKFDDDGVKRLDDLARTLVLNEASNEAIFVVELTHLLGSDKATPEKRHIFWLLNQFISCGLVDKHVIEGIVSFGADMNAYEDALPTVNTMFYMLVTGAESRGAGPAVPNDSQSAVAIKSGLFDVIFHIMQKFSSQATGDLLEQLVDLLDALGQVALMQR